MKRNDKQLHIMNLSSIEFLCDQIFTLSWPHLSTQPNILVQEHFIGLSSKAVATGDTHSGPSTSLVFQPYIIVKEKGNIHSFKHLINSPQQSQEL